MQLRIFIITALCLMLTGISKIIAQTMTPKGKIYTKPYRDYDTIFLKGGQIHLVKIIDATPESILYEENPTIKTHIRMKNESYDSVKMGEEKLYNYRYERSNNLKKIYFEGSFGAGLGNRNSHRTTRTLTGLLSIGYQFKENWGLGISSISIIPFDDYYIQYINSVTLDSRFFSEKSVFTFHFGFVTKRTKLQGSDICEFNANTKKFNPSLGLSFRRFIRKNFMLGISGVFSSFPTVCSQYDYQTRGSVLKNYNESIAALSLQLGFTFPKPFKEVRIQ